MSIARSRATDHGSFQRFNGSDRSRSCRRLTVSARLHPNPSLRDDVRLVRQPLRRNTSQFMRTRRFSCDHPIVPRHVNQPCERLGGCREWSPVPRLFAALSDLRRLEPVLPNVRLKLAPRTAPKPRPPVGAYMGRCDLGTNWKTFPVVTMGNLEAGLSRNQTCLILVGHASRWLHQLKIRLV